MADARLLSHISEHIWHICYAVNLSVSRSFQQTTTRTLTVAQRQYGSYYLFLEHARLGWLACICVNHTSWMSVEISLFELGGSLGRKNQREEETGQIKRKIDEVNDWSKGSVVECIRLARDRQQSGVLVGSDLRP